MLSNIYTDNKMDVSDNRYKILFSFENAYAVFHKKKSVDAKSSLEYECVYYENHDCVFPGEVLIDIMFRIRSGDFQCLRQGDILCVRVNGQLLSYIFCGIQSWNPQDVYSNFAPFSSQCFTEEKKNIIYSLHKKGTVLDILSGTLIPIHDNDKLLKYHFFGIEQEDYSIKALNMVSEYSVYCLEKNQITKINPNGNPFYDLKNAMFFFLNKCRANNQPSVLLFNRKELEMVKDCLDLKFGSAYEA
jgi:hypothetical protein